MSSLNCPHSEHPTFCPHLLVPGVGRPGLLSGLLWGILVVENFLLVWNTLGVAAGGDGWIWFLFGDFSEANDSVYSQDPSPSPCDNPEPSTPS